MLKMSLPFLRSQPQLEEPASNKDLNNHSSTSESQKTQFDIHSVCVNCCIPFTNSDVHQASSSSSTSSSSVPVENEIFRKERSNLNTQRVQELPIIESFEAPSSSWDNVRIRNENRIKSNSTKPNITVGNVLSSVYKLDYLNFLPDSDKLRREQIPLSSYSKDTSDTEAMITDAEIISVCVPCAEVLSTLYKAYEDFNKLRHTESYLAQNLNRLDRLIKSLTWPFEESELIEAEINPALIKVEPSSDSDELDNGHFDQELDPDPHEDQNLHEDLCQDTRNLVSPHSQSVLSSTSIGPPWVYVRRLRSSDLTSYLHSKASITTGLGTDKAITRKRKRSYDDETESANLDAFHTDEHCNYNSTTTDVSVAKARLRSNSVTKSLLQNTTESESEAKSKIKVQRKPKEKPFVTKTGFKLKPKSKAETKASSRGRTKSKSVISKPNKVADSKVENEYESSEELNPGLEPIVKSKSTSKSKSRRRNPVRGGRYLQFFLRKQKVPCPCWYCELDFHSESDRADHLRSAHFLKSKESQYIICEPCGKIFTLLTNFNNHMPRCGLPPPKTRLPPFICQYCSKQFNEARLLQGHEKLVHLTEKSIPCDRCPYKAKTTKQLRIHERNKHDESTNNPEAAVTCHLCNSTTLKNQYQLKLHIERMHTVEGRKKYDAINQKAAVRDKEVRRRNALTSFICTECNIDFQTKVRLTKHRLAVHVTDKKYICELCGKGFIESYRLKKHIQFTHTEERPYICEQCGKSFKSIFNLNTHIDNSHDEQKRKKYNEYMRENNRKRMEIARAVAAAAAGSGQSSNNKDSGAASATVQRQIQIPNPGQSYLSMTDGPEPEMLVNDLHSILIDSQFNAP